MSERAFDSAIEGLRRNLSEAPAVPKLGPESTAEERYRAVVDMSLQMHERARLLLEAVETLHRCQDRRFDEAEKKLDEIIRLLTGGATA